MANSRKPMWQGGPRQFSVIAQNQMVTLQGEEGPFPVGQSLRDTA
jgi:hypothetical protein